MIKIQRNVVYCSLLYIFIFITLNILNQFYNMDFFALIIYFSLLYIIFRFKREILIKYMFMVVMFTYHICSVFTVENFPNFIDNLQVMSYHSGAFLPLLTSYVLGFITILILEMNRNSKILKTKNISEKNGIKIGNMVISNKSQIKLVSFILIAVTMVMIIKIGKNGFYSMGGIDRFAYRENYFSSFDSKFYTYISWFLPIPLICANNGMKKRAYFFFVIYCFYLIWVGDKFGSLFLAFYFYLLVHWATKKLDKKKVRTLIIMIFLVLLILMLFISYQVFYERGSISEIYEYFNNRLIGGQSDLWWGVFTKETNSGWRLGEFFKDELSAIFSQPDSWMDYNFGIYKMMRVTAPAWVVNNYLSRGVRFAASTQATLYYYFKYTGLYLGGILMFVLYFFVVNKAIKAYKNNDILSSVCYTMLLSKSIQLTTMSAIDMLGNTTTILCLFYILIKHQFEFRKRKEMRIESE